MRTWKWILLLWCGLPGLVAGQKPSCASSEWQAYRKARDPGLVADEARFNAQLKAATEAAATQRSQNDTARLVIPLAFHIVHDNGPENLPDSMVHRAVDFLNLAFANQEYYDPTVGVPTYISFCLTAKGKWGEPSNGINRIEDADYLTLSSFQGDDDLKLAYAFPTDKVLNIYSIGNIAFATAYASFPQLEEGSPYQGIVIESDFIGHSERRGAILAHEVGHFLGLYHTFQDNCRNFDCLLEGDRVCDTPPDAIWRVREGCVPNNNCPTDADDPSPNNPFLFDGPDQNSNFMDYNNFACMKVFTEGQRTRMRFAARIFRPRLLASEYCFPNLPRDAAIYEVRNASGLVCADSLYPRVRVINYGSAYLTDLRLYYAVDAGPEAELVWRGQIGPEGSLGWIDLPAVAVPGPGKHRLTVRTAFPNNFPDMLPHNDTLRTEFWQPFPGFVPFREDFETGWPADWIPLNAPGDVWALAATGSCDAAPGENQALYLRNEFHRSPLENTFLSPVLDLDRHTDAVLRFDHAFARQEELYRLQYLNVSVIPYCDPDAAEQVFSRSQQSMLEAIVNDQSFVWAPTNCDEWGSSEVDLSDYAGQKILLSFTTNIGRQDFDRIYLDNIAVTSSYAEEKSQNGIEDADIRLYPNPNAGQVWIDMPVYAAGDLGLRIYDTAGQLVWQQEESLPVSRYFRELDLRRLATGTYFLRIDLGEQRFMKKLVVYFQ